MVGLSAACSTLPRAGFFNQPCFFDMAYTRKLCLEIVVASTFYNELSSASRDNLSEAYKISNEILCLPIYPDLSKEDQGRVINAILDVAES